MTMDDILIGLLQIRPGQSLEEMQIRGENACREAKALGADIALFPEMWSSGYDLSGTKEDVQNRAIKLDDPFLLFFQTLAKELEMAIAITLLESFSPSPRNSLILFDRHGKTVLHYAKVHICEFDKEEGFLRPGNHFPVTSLDTAKGELQVGAMICYDREFPESARILMLHGAEIILVPNACPMEINRVSQLRARAFENMLGIATANYPLGHPDCNGHSTAFDGMAYLPEEESSRDTCILEAGEEEGVFIARFPIERMRRYRQQEVHGNAYRRPECYEPLISKEVREPFVRERTYGGSDADEA